MNTDRNQVREWLIIAIVFVVFSVVAFAVPFVHNGVFWVSYVFTAVAVLAQVVFLKKAFHEGETVTSKFFGFPIARIGVMYLAAQAVLGLVFMALAAHLAVWIPLVVSVVLLGAAAVGLIAADAAREQTERVEAQQKADVRTMRGLQAQAKAMAASCADAATKKQLQELSDELRFSDPVSKASLLDVEEQLEEQMKCVQAALDTADYAEAGKAIAKARRTLAKRNMLCRDSKK